MFSLALTLAAGCTEHFTTQEAYAICEELQEKGPSTATDASFADCVACHEDCGGECAPQGTAPETYACPDETGETSETGETAGE
jgi:hypothetical protein